MKSVILIILSPFIIASCNIITSNSDDENHIGPDNIVDAKWELVSIEDNIMGFWEVPDDHSYTIDFKEEGTYQSYVFDSANECEAKYETWASDSISISVRCLTDADNRESIAYKERLIHSKTFDLNKSTLKLFYVLKEAKNMENGVLKFKINNK